METQLEIDTMNAVPTPRFDVGENTFAAQLLQYTYERPPFNIHSSREELTSRAGRDCSSHQRPRTAQSTARRSCAS